MHKLYLSNFKQYVFLFSLKEIKKQTLETNFVKIRRIERKIKNATVRTVYHI
jgi:hypothetical protein